MLIASSSINMPYTSTTVRTRVESFGVSMRTACNATTRKIKEALVSPIGQGVIGVGIGFVVAIGAPRIYGPLSDKIVKYLGITTALPDPINGLSLGIKILLSPLVCVFGPISEEKTFRGDLQTALKTKFESFYLNRGFSVSAARTTARVTAIFFASTVFGLIHFANALLFWCNPVLFLPQVVAATLLGLVLGLAKELSGELHIPTGMHIGINTFAWLHHIKASL